MADRFFTPHPVQVGEFVLDGAEAHHLAHVRRFGPGDRVTLFNGDGREYPAEVLSIGKRSVALSVLAAVEADREVGFELVVASALPKADRADFLVEKLTELGATRFVPLSTARSVVRPSDAKSEKLARAVVEASKQCGRNRLMAVDPPVAWDRFLRAGGLPAVRLVLHTGPGLPVWRGADVRAGVAVAVGPEGGFDADEVDAASRAGWQAVSLGPRTLRIETAALAIVARLTTPG